MTTMLKKISPKSLKCQEVGSGFELYGKIGMMRTVNTDKGESVQLFGTLRAIVDETGEVFEGISCFLPGGYDHLFAAQLKNAQDESKGAVIEICHHFEKKKADNPLGAEWIMTTLSKNSGGSAALDELQKNALPSPKKLLKLEAPKAAKGKK